MENNTQHVFNTYSLFENSYLCAKALFMQSFSMIPSANYIGDTDGEKSFNAIKAKYGDLFIAVHTYRYYDAKTKGYDFNQTYIVMKNNCVLEFDIGCCEIYHDGKQPEFIKSITELVRGFKQRERWKPLEINLVIKGRSGMQLKAMEIKPTRLDLDLYYEDDFKETDNVIRKRLNKKNDKGIVLLHGLPGTGKTTYLRYLVGKIKKRVLFLSPGVAANIMDPDFIELLINNPNSVLVIEDAENIIMDRKASSNASVSNLLNISDGLLADFLNVQIICTFNSSLTLVDSALMRKGRLIAKYEFGKLGINKSQRLSKHFNFDTIINQPMTIAEIINQHEKEQKAERLEVTGFRRNELVATNYL